MPTLRYLKAKVMKASYNEPTEEMLAFFKKRTREHIGRVVNYLRLFEGFQGLTKEELAERGKDHDRDKYADPKMVVPYIWVTEYHKVKNAGGEISDDLQAMYDKAREATGKHITVNRHHPEFHESTDAMTTLDLVEMVCDWAAMAEELGDGSPRGWADKNVGSKWKFSPEQTELIYDAIKVVEDSLQ